MLRQIYIFHNQKLIFSHSLALGIGREELKNVIGLIESYLIMPMPGKTFHRPLSHLQIFHRGLGSIYFLIITDLVDTPDYIDEILKKIINKFKELFPNPVDVKESSPLKSKFLKFLYEIQKNLHSKIAIVGPLNSGKTTLYNILKADEERIIIDFAKSSLIQIDNLSFDIWDFQLQENFSLLLSKFIGGSDLILLLFDSKNFNLKLIDHFLNLIKKDSKFSKILVIANKSDLIRDEDFEGIKSIINFPNIKSLSLISKNAKSNLIQLIREGLNLKKHLPSNFEKLINEAEKLSIEGDITVSIERYGGLIKISNELQDFTYINALQEKLEDLKVRKQKQIEEKKQLQRKKKYSVPDQIKFTQKILVKDLPKKDSSIIETPQKPTLTAYPKPSPKRITPIKPKTSVQASKAKRLTLRPEDIKLNIKLTTKKTETFQKQVDKPKIQIKKIHIKNSLKPIKFTNHVKSITNHIKELTTPAEKTASIQKFDFSKELQKLIIQKDTNLSLELCRTFIEEMLNSLKKPLTLEDLKIAAKYFYQIESGILSL